MAKIFQNGFELTAEEIARYANIVHQRSGGNGKPFTALMFIPNSNNYRFSGNHCNCGCDESIVGKPSLGEFDLCSVFSDEVREGGKAYMVCRKCGCYSHL